MSFGHADVEMTNGLNAFFAEQAKQDGVCLVDYVQFDNKYEVVFTDKPVAEAEALILPRGGTALVDAIGRGTVELGQKLKGLPESLRPGTVIVVVVTDGQENASREYTAEQVRELVKMQREEYGWDYVFLGANIDAVATGQQYGFAAGSSMTYTAGATHATTQMLSTYATVTRSGGAASFTDEDRKRAMGQS